MSDAGSRPGGPRRTRADPAARRGAAGRRARRRRGHDAGRSVWLWGAKSGFPGATSARPCSKSRAGRRGARIEGDGWTGWSGPDERCAERVVRGDPGPSSVRCCAMLETKELFVVQRQQPGRLSWEPHERDPGRHAPRRYQREGARCCGSCARAPTSSRHHHAARSGVLPRVTAGQPAELRRGYMGGGAALAAGGCRRHGSTRRAQCFLPCC